MKHLFFFYLLLTTCNATAQQPQTTDFYRQIKDYDLSSIFHADTIYAESERKEDALKLPEPIGFIGNNYQRFYIHFLSVTKSRHNPYKYYVIGKTRVNRHICAFKGNIVIMKSKKMVESIDSDFQEGFVECAVKFFEDSSVTGSGKITGELDTDWKISNANKITYDALLLVADGYSNNEFTGIWKGYRKNVIKKCHWGDFRIPDCGNLDIGTGEFMVNNKYLKNGWKSYVGQDNDLNPQVQRKARAEEIRKWWK